MEQPSDTRPVDPVGQAPSPRGELIIQNGRLSGTRRALTTPITTVGRAEGCDIRLNVESVHPFQCVLAFGPTGLTLRNLPVENSTLVNGQAVALCALHEGDLLSIGPFQFQVHLPGDGPAAGAGSLEQEQEALRIQAAAVAAQQAALTEEEIRLEHRRIGLEQEQQQLATHLEERRRRLIRLRDEARQARASLQQMRTAHEERVAHIACELSQSRQELADNERQVQVERQRLFALRQRLKRRFHRHWSSERMAMRLRETELATLRRDLNEERERLQQQKNGMMQARMRCNGEMELGRRRLQADEEELRAQRAELLQRASTLDLREAAQDKRERELAQEKRRWEKVRVRLQQEVEGLENRITNSRRLLLDQKRLSGRLEAVSGQMTRPKSSPESSTVSTQLTQPIPPAAVLAPVEAQLQPVWQQQHTDAELANRVAALSQVAGELADQRLHLAEQFERLARGQQQWQRDREAAATELEALGQRLQEREEAVRTREQAVSAVEHELQQRAAELSREQRRLDACRAQLAVRVALWEGERDRLLASLRARHDLVDQRLAALSDLRARWGKRRQRQLCRWRALRGACAELRREGQALRQEWLNRTITLGKEQRALAERALALEQYRQRWIARAANPKAAEKRLERLRRRWAARAASAERTLAREQKSLETQAARLEERARQLHEDADQVSAQEAELSSRQAAWEQQQLHDQGQQEETRHDLQSLRRQRDVYEQQLEALRDEVERLARLLLDDDDSQRRAVMQAA